MTNKRFWFTADWHAGHTNIIKYCNRPFKEAGEMDETLLRNYNEVVSEGDIVFFLGDLTFKIDIAKSLLERMKGDIVYVFGNHDTKILTVLEGRCESVHRLLDIEVEDQPITLCHYAMRVWNKSHFDSWQLFGHSHGRLKPAGKQWDVGVDNNNFKPISFEEIKTLMDKQPHNSDYIGLAKRR